ncbi:MAG: hypothetical protein ABEH77_10550 [Halobacteriaceae archaeon]
MALGERQDVLPELLVVGGARVDVGLDVSHSPHSAWWVINCGEPHSGALGRAVAGLVFAI